MPLSLRWVGDDELDRVAVTRMRCYAPAAKELEKFQVGIRADVRGQAGDFLLAEQDGEPVGTSTAHSFTMWVRGGAVACQGVAFVGTVRTHRRGSSGGQPGIATRLMQATLDRARERGEAVSALMPFRASFYEHFGYGLVERRHDWNVPLSVLPHGNFDGFRYYRTDDLDELSACRQRIVCRGQCDIKRPKRVWPFHVKKMEEGFFVVDRPSEGGPVKGFVGFTTRHEAGKDHIRVVEQGYEDRDALLRQLHFLASLKDQYLTATLTLPADLPFNWLLRERQIPHRPVNHAAVECKAYSRMQVRVLDHKAFLEAMTLPEETRGRAVVAVRETEGSTSTFAVDIASGRAAVAPSDATPQFECNDVVWAAIACGEMPATKALELGLATGSAASAAAALDALAVGPLPFCNEYF